MPSQKERKLIVNADDFGIDPGVNRGIIQGHAQGIITSASLLSCGKAFAEAAQLGKEQKNLGLGVHLALNEEEPACARENIGSLLDKGGRLLDFSNFYKHYLLGKIRLSQVYLEFEAQINRFRSSGLSPTHLDGHKHIHLLPGILDVALELAIKYKIPRMRLSREPYAISFASKKYFRALAVWALSALAKMQLPKIKKYGVKTPDYCYGLAQSGQLDEENLLRLLRYLPYGENELICHPGELTREAASRNRLKELDGLKGPGAKDLIKQLNIQLIRYDGIN